MPIDRPEDAIGLRYEDALAAHVHWGSKYPVIHPDSHLIHRLMDRSQPYDAVLVNVLPDGSVRPCADGDGFDAAIEFDEATRLGFEQIPGSKYWRKP